MSKKEYLYDDAVVEVTFKIIKTEFVFNRILKSFEELEISFFDYVNWYNKFRVHSSFRT
ncbi:MAG: IS3 family transposase [Filifactoraceae bacterium]